MKKETSLTAETETFLTVLSEITTDKRGAKFVAELVKAIRKGKIPLACVIVDHEPKNVALSPEPQIKEPKLRNRNLIASADWWEHETLRRERNTYKESEFSRSEDAIERMNARAALIGLRGTPAIRIEMSRNAKLDELARTARALLNCCDRAFTPVSTDPARLPVTDNAKAVRPLKHFTSQHLRR